MMGRGGEDDSHGRCDQADEAEPRQRNEEQLAFAESALGPVLAGPSFLLFRLGLAGDRRCLLLVRYFYFSIVCVPKKVPLQQKAPAVAHLQASIAPDA